MLKPSEIRHPMSIQLTRNAKHTLIVDTPVMPASGTVGMAFTYHNLIEIDKLGAFVTNPITYEPWSPATGTRVIPLESGVLVHTGLPNNGLNKTIKEYHPLWRDMPIPVILHLVATNVDHIQRAIERIDQHDGIAAVELGLDDDITWKDAEAFVKAAVAHAEKPILVRLPAYDANEIASTVADAGADALVVAAAPRGTARDLRSGKLVSGRIYGPLVKPMILRLVGVLARRIKDVPIIGSGGIHSIQDARDYLEAGAVAVQVDSALWIQPNILERIARDLGGSLMTRPNKAFPDEWHPDMGDTEFQKLFSEDDADDESNTPVQRK
jgi:dihydroorotate dehydrogenase (NAD+) catalytic subunit